MQPKQGHQQDEDLPEDSYHWHTAEDQKPCTVSRTLAALGVTALAA